ncbi:MAG TPA: beta-propeller fold lactonase family protein [Terriglobia bacterium]
MIRVEDSRRVLVMATLAIVLAMVSFTRPAHSQSSTALNVVYVESNIGSTKNSNSVFAYSNDGTGKLTAVAGSPFLTGGTGVYDPSQEKGKTEFDADQQVLVSPSNNLLFAVNGDSNTFAVFSISTANGSLAALPGSPFKSNGSDPVSFGLLYNILTGPESWLAVVNKGADPNQTDAAPNISVFRVTSAGIPTLDTKATVNLTANTSPSQILTATGSAAKHQFWAFLDQYQTAGSSLAGIYSYLVQGNGGLKSVNFTADPTDPPTLGLAANSKYRVLYAGLPTLNEVGVFFYSPSTGTTTFSSAVANPGKGVGWLAVGPTGTAHFLYTSEAGSGTVTVYQITGNGLTLTQVQQFTLTGASTIPGNLAFDTTGKFLYCLDNVHATLHVLDVDSTTGKLSEPNAPIALNVPTGEEPLGLAVD